MRWRRPEPLALLGMLSLMGCGEGEGHMDADRLQELGAAYTAAWNRLDPAGVASFHGEASFLVVNDAEPAVGREAIAEVAQGFMTAFPDMVLEMDSIVPTPDGARYHWTYSGTNTGPGGTGMAVRFSGYEEWDLADDGLIAGSRGHFDEEEYNHQLQYGVGASPAVASASEWIALFDGRSTRGWRGYNQPSFPAGAWSVRDGELVVAGPEERVGAGGDIITEATFSDFELEFEFLVGREGNSGVFYRVVEHEGLDMWMVAPEYQVLDDTAYIQMGTMDMRTHMTGDNYDLHASAVRATNPLGTWNQGRIVVDGARIQHWLNGTLTVEYDLWSPEWEALVAASKFAPYAPYGRAAEGHIGLQDHDAEVRYRNIRIRPLVGGR